MGQWHSLNLTNGTVLAFAGLSNVSFKAPVYPRDQIHTSFEVSSKRELASRSNGGLVKMKLNAFNQRNELVLEAEIILIMKKREITKSRIE